MSDVIESDWRLEHTMKSQEKTITRDPEDRIINRHSIEERREKMMDKTIADSFPASDPPSSIPDPDEDSFRSISIDEGHGIAA